MKVRIDPDVCSGHARCWTVDGENFQLDDGGCALRPEFDVPAEA